MVAVFVTAGTAFVLLEKGDTPDPEAVRLDFETGDLSQYDSIQRAADDRLRVVHDPTREGRFAARFEVRAGDEQRSTSGIRAELIAERDGGRKARAGDERWYRWSTLFPRNYRVTDEWQTFVQWKNDGTGSPPLAMTVHGEEIRLSGGRQNDFRRFWRAPIEPGRWHDFIAHARWSPDSRKGFVELWHNGRLVVPRASAATMYRDSRGHPIPNYFKIGLYRSSAIRATQVVYHDAVRVGETRSAVLAGGAGR